MSAALEASPVQLDGMTVVFDKKAGLVPVELEKKDQDERTNRNTRRQRD